MTKPKAKHSLEEQVAILTHRIEWLENANRNLKREQKVSKEAVSQIQSKVISAMEITAQVLNQVIEKMSTT